MGEEWLEVNDKILVKLFLINLLIGKVRLCKRKLRLCLKMNGEMLCENIMSVV